MACELSVRIVPGDAKCKQYRKSLSDTCRSCIEFTTDEVTDMPTKITAGPKKGEKFDCPLCGKHRTYESDGLCGSCKKKQRDAKKATQLPTGPVVKAPVEYPDLDADAAEVSASFGKVANVEGAAASFGVDPMAHMAMRDAWYEAERKALEALSGLPPISALARAHAFVQQIQALEVQP